MVCGFAFAPAFAFVIVCVCAVAVAVVFASDVVSAFTSRLAFGAAFASAFVFGVAFAFGGSQFGQAREKECEPWPCSSQCLRVSLLLPLRLHQLHRVVSSSSSRWPLRLP